MKRNLHPRLMLLVLTLTALACSFSFGGQSPIPNVDQVASVVAATMQALTPAPGGGGVSTPAPGILPGSMYFIGNDPVGLTQVFRLEADGRTLRQITTEPSPVNGYDVSPVDGSVVYVANNQILLINADGSGRRLLVDGGPVDQNDLFVTSIGSPIFSPDGQTIAYSNKGLVLYSVATGASNLVLNSQATDPATGAVVIREMYIPEEYSPDGSKILLTVAIPNSDGIGAGVYYPASNSLIRLTGDFGAAVCCGQPEWTLDSSALYTASATLGMFGSGLWRIDTASGNSMTLLSSDAGGGNFNLASHPYLAPDGQLYFFYASQPAPDGFIDNAPVQLVRAAPDGVTGRTVLRPETFESLNEALWAPDASFVIAALAPSQDVYQGGRAEIVYMDGRPNVMLAAFARQMKWGP